MIDMKGIPHTRLPANTLPEVLVSLALIGLAFALGTQLTSVFTGATSPPEQARSILLAEAWLNEPLGPNLVLSQERKVEGRLLKRELDLVNPATHLVRIEVQVYTGERLLLSRWRYTFWDIESNSYAP